MHGVPSQSNSRIKIDFICPLANYFRAEKLHSDNVACIITADSSIEFPVICLILNNFPLLPGLRLTCWKAHIRSPKSLSASDLKTGLNYISTYLIRLEMSFLGSMHTWHYQIKNQKQIKTKVVKITIWFIQSYHPTSLEWIRLH